MVKLNPDIRLKINSLSELDSVAAQLLEAAASYKVWLFYGEMGAGKTTLIKAICRKLMVSDSVVSPTFSIVNEYLSDEGPIYHFDFYRVKNTQEAEQAGVEDFFYSGHYCFIEWPDLVLPLLPESFVRIEIEDRGNEARTYHLSNYGKN